MGIEHLEDDEFCVVQASIRDGKLDLLQHLLANRPNLVHSCRLGSSLLSEAISNNSLAATRILLDAGANPFPADALGHALQGGHPTMLELASYKGNRDILRLLLDQLKAIRSADIIVIDDEDASQLMKRSLLKAAECGNAHIVGDFLDLFEWDHQTISDALHCAAMAWQADSVDLIMDRVQFEKHILDRLLLQVIPEMVFCSDVDQLPLKYKTSHYAKQYRVVSRLIDSAGVDVRVAKQGSPLLREAVNAIEIYGALKALLDKGADPNTQWENGYTALHLLATPIGSDCQFLGEYEYKVHEDGIRLLLEKGASINIRDNEGVTASHLAAERCDTAIFLRYFLPADPDLLATTHSGDTLLHYAAAGGKHETVQYLLSRDRFDVNATNSSSWTPLLCALTANSSAHKTETGAVKSARLFLNLGADVKAETAEGLTILHLLGSHEDTIKLTPSEIEDFELRYYKVDPEEEVEVLDNESSAAALARELYSGPLDLPSIQSSAQVYRHKSEAEKWEKRRHIEASWGGIANRMYTQGDTSSSSVTVIHGRTPLHWAAEYGAAGVARVLRELGGADDDAKDSEGNMPWDLAHRSRKIGSRAKYATKKAVE